MTYLIMKDGDYWRKKPIEEEVLANLKDKPTPTAGESPELTALKKNLTDSKELFKAMIAVANSKSTTWKSNSKKQLFKANSIAIKDKLNWGDIDPDSADDSD